MKRLLVWGTLVTLAFLPFTASPTETKSLSGDPSAPRGDYKLLTPISRGDLTIFPVVSSMTHGDRFRAFELTSLLGRNEFDVHLSKMVE